MTDFLACVALAISIAAPDSPAVDLEVTPGHGSRINVRITRRDWPGNAWELRLPEYIVLYRQADTTVRPDVTERVDGSVRIRGERPSHGRGRYEFVLTPRDDAIDIECTVTNTGRRPWDGAAHALSCLVFRDAPDFTDSTMARTTVVVEGELVTIAGLGAGAPRHFRHNSQPLRDADAVWMQHRAPERAPVPVSASLIVRSSADGRRHVAAAWDDAFSVAYNFDLRLNCIHSNPRFGALRGGATQTLHGRVYFFAGSLDSLYARFERDFPGGGYGVNR